MRVYQKREKKGKLNENLECQYFKEDRKKRFLIDEGEIKKMKSVKMGMG